MDFIVSFYGLSPSTLSLLLTKDGKEREMKGNITKMKDFSSQVLPAVTIDFLFHDLYRRSFPQRLDPELLRRYNFYNPILEGFAKA